MRTKSSQHTSFSRSPARGKDFGPCFLSFFPLRFFFSKLGDFGERLDGPSARIFFSVCRRKEVVLIECFINTTRFRFFFLEDAKDSMEFYHSFRLSGSRSVVIIPRG